MDLSKLRPLGDRVIVKVDEADDKTPGGIYIPQNAKEPLTRGVLVAVGPGRVLDTGALKEPRVKVGDRVIFGKYAGSDVQGVDQRDTHRVLTEDELLAVVED